MALLGVTRTVIVHTTLPEGELLFFRMTGRETLCRPFEYEVELLSENPNIGLSDILGQPITITIELPGYTQREFNGIVSQFSFTGEMGRHAAYRATIRPWVWFLSHSQDCRIFQALTVPAVIEQIFRDHGFSDFTNALTGEYRTWEYLVQYRESDLNFVTRIMELEGIYYFFKHVDGKHILVLADSYSAHEPAPGYATLPYYPPQTGERREQEHVDRWLVRRSIRPATYRARDFNFTRPAEPIEQELRAPLDHARNEAIVYDYPGQYQDTAEAQTQTRVRLEEHQVDFEVFHAEANARGLSSGGLFTLTNFPRDDQNKEYLIVDAAYDISIGTYESIERSADQPEYRMSFAAIDSTRPYRPPALTRKPVVEGPQTATVVGQAGQEIWTDEHGRVRLKFHWDRTPERDENCACWVRVSQAWAGAGWGSMHIPRIDQEVIVDFLEGDPDRPIVTGRVYNGNNKPPYKLPDNQTQSGIKSRSTKGGTDDNFNEIRFEDKKGEEELYLQAEKNMTTLVKNDQSTSVKANRSASVGANDSVSVTGNRSVTVQGTHTVTVTKADTETYSNTRAVSVLLTDDLTVTGAHTGKYQAARTLTVKGPDALKVTAGDKTVDVTGNYNSSATVQFKAKQGENELLLTAAQAKLKNANCKVDLNGGKLTIEASEEIQLKVGGNTITIKSDGTIAVGATQKSTMSGAGGSLETGPTGSKLQGQMVNISGDATVEVVGAIIKLN